MVKTHIIKKDGTKIIIEGNPREVAEIVSKLESDISISKTPKRSTSQKTMRTLKKQKITPINLISSLIDGGFFRKPKDLAVIKVALEELGHFYPVTSLSPALLRLVRKRQLRRIKDKKRWLYTS